MRRGGTIAVAAAVAALVGACAGCRVPRRSPCAVEIRRESGLTPCLVVLGPDGPIEGAYVSVVEAGRTPLSKDDRRTGADGSVRWSALDPSAEYRLAVTFAQGHVGFVASHWKPRDETLHLRREVAFEGVVTDADGRPLFDALVEARPWPDEPESFVRQSTDSDGRFHFGSAPEGDLLLRVTTEYDLGVTEAVVCVAANGADAHVVHAPQGEWHVRIAGWREEVGHRGGTYVVVFVGSPIGTSRSLPVYEIDSEGAFSLRGVREDVTYTVWSQPFGTDLYVLATSLPYEPRGTTLAISHGASIRGRVISPADARPAYVGATRDRLRVRGSVDADGTYVIRGLPPGTWKVWAHSWTPSGMFHASVVAAAGEEVDLELTRVSDVAPR